MLFPVKAHYAAVAMLHLAVRYHEPQPVSIREVAQEHQIPLAFLTQIFQFLRSAGLVTSTRGPSGGFRLSLPPEEISLGTVIDAVYSLAPHEPDVSGSGTQQIVSKVWNEFDLAMRSYLDGIKLSQLVAKHQLLSEAMFYI